MNLGYDKAGSWADADIEAYKDHLELEGSDDLDGVRVGDKIDKYLNDNINEKTLNRWREALANWDNLPTIKTDLDVDCYIYERLFWRQEQVVDCATGRRVEDVEDEWSHEDEDDDDW